MSRAAGGQPSSRRPSSRARSSASRTAAPLSRATRRTSSNSGVTVTTRPSRRDTLKAMAPRRGEADHSRAGAPAGRRSSGRRWWWTPRRGRGPAPAPAGLAERGQHHPGPALLHDHRGEIHVERPRREEPLHQGLVELRGHVVHRGLHLHDRLGAPGCGAASPRRPAPRWACRAPWCRPRSRPPMSHGRHGARGRGERGQDGGARWRDQLALDAGVHHREAPEELGGVRGGHGDAAVWPANDAAAHRERGAVHRVHPEQVEADAGAGDVHDGVDRAHVVEVHRSRRLAVYPRLGLGQPCEDAGRIPLRLGERAPRDEVEDAGRCAPDARDGPARLARARPCTCTSTLVARKPPFITSRRSRRVAPERHERQLRARASKGTPASTSAPRIMSPAAPLGQSK